MSVDDDARRLGGQHGTAFLLRQTVLIGSVACPLGVSDRAVVGSRLDPPCYHGHLDVDGSIDS
jgi:hypothetical protein